MDADATRPTEPARSRAGSPSPVDPQPRRSGTAPDRHYVVEAAIIVGSILLALLLDAAWDYRGERAREAEYIAGLREEFRASADELALDQTVRGEILDRVGTLLAAARAGRPIPADSAAPWTNALINFRFFSPVHSVLDDLLAGGNLSLLRSAELRFALLLYVQERGRLAVAEERERDFIADHLEPYLSGRIRINDILPVQSLDDAIELGPVDSGALAAIASDPAFANLAFLRWERTETARRFAGSVNRAIARVLELLEP